MKTILIADLTRNRSAGNLVRYANGLLESEEVCQVIAVSRDNQAAPDLADDATTIQVAADLPHFQIAYRIFQEAQARLSETDVHVKVLSLHDSVLLLRSNFQIGVRSRIQIDRWPEHLKEAPQQGTGEWPADLLPLEDALKSLLVALRKRGAYSKDTAVWQTDVRRLLSDEEPRLDKRHPHPRAQTRGLISMLIRAARDRKVIATEERAGGGVNPKVWLVPSAVSSPNIRSSDDSGSGPHQNPSRSQVFLNILRRLGLHPNPRVRLLLWESLKLEVNQLAGKPEALAALVRRAIKNTREMAETRGVQLGTNYPWKKLRGFVYKVMQEAPVLLDETNHPTAPSISTLHTNVSGLLTDWELWLEAVLVVELVRECQDIALADIEYLAGALYFSRSEESIEKVENTLLFLQRKGAISESGGPHYVLRVEQGVRTLLSAAAN